MGVRLPEGPPVGAGSRVITSIFPKLTGFNLHRPQAQISLRKETKMAKKLAILLKRLTLPQMGVALRICVASQ